MKTTLLSLVVILSSANAFAVGCDNVVTSIGIADSFALFCKGGCNVMDALGPVFKKNGKKGSLTPTATLIGTGTDGTLQYSLVVTYTDDQKKTTQVSNYDITTNDKCLIQSVTRK
ncbi:MAG: hypothetical protein JST80_11345 [Bdellovibrionales bacterium]|nr:hypothetical protein [Bdellovibrionales bacterium]